MPDRGTIPHMPAEIELDPDDSFALMLKDVPQVKPKNLEESIELAKRIEAGRLPDGKLNEDARQARDELVFSCKGMLFPLLKNTQAPAFLSWTLCRKASSAFRKLPKNTITGEDFRFPHTPTGGQKPV